MTYEINWFMVPIVSITLAAPLIAGLMAVGCFMIDGSNKMKHRVGGYLLLLTCFAFVLSPILTDEIRPAIVETFLKRQAEQPTK